ncbi:MAG: cation transporter [Selenomonadaceae bacterium]|nr:cation transporter [Selenomonadaceae bacterium]
MSEAKNEQSREKIIVNASVVGIVANVLLAAFKAAVGLMANSIAIVLDAVNNISDAASSIITIVGAKLAAKEPNKEHPFGYGRIEYMSAVIISVIVLYAGLTSLTESAKQIFNPETPSYDATALIIVAVAVVIKIFLGRYVKSVGEKVNSDALINSGEDAKLDSVISASTLVAAVIFLTFNIAVEAYLGVIISLVIIKAGIDMLKETLSKILGERNDIELDKKIKETVTSFTGVRGAYDLVLNNYGPDTWRGSVHIEVPDTYGADKLDKMLREIMVEVFKKHRVLLTAIGVYSFNTKDEEVKIIEEKVRKIVFSYPYVRQIHGFYLTKETKNIRFDLVISFDAKSRNEAFKEAVEKVKEEFPDYEISAVMDTDFAEE